jgi:type IV pilus assembly protein PilA
VTIKNVVAVVLIFFVILLFLSAYLVLRDSRHRTYVQTALSQSYPLKDAVTDHFHKTGLMPPDTAVLPAQTVTIFSKSDAATGAYQKNGSLVLTMLPNTEEVAQETLILLPKIDGKRLVWDCTGGTVKQKYRPSACRVE